MDPRYFDSSPPSPDPPSASFAMPTPAIGMQMPSPDIPEMSYAYSQPDVYGRLDAYSQPNAYSQSNASEYPFSSELPYAAEHLNPFQQPFVSEQAFDDPPHVLMSYYPSAKPQLSDWVPKVEGMSDEVEVDPMSEPIYIHTPDPVTLTPTSISRKPSRLRRIASFLGLGPKEPKVSPRS